MEAMSKGITEKPEFRAPLPEWKPAHETAPSVMRDDQDSVARMLGLTGLCFVVIGAGIILLARIARVNPAVGVVAVVLGGALLLFHASRDADRQIRRTYGIKGYLWLVLGLLVLALPIRGWTLETRFLPYAFSAFTFALLFLMPFARNETEDSWRTPAVLILGLIGLAAALFGFVGSNFDSTFLLPHGLLLALLGLFYLWAFVGLNGTATDRGYAAGLALGALGALFFLVALGRSIITPLVVRSGGASYLTSGGAILMGLGLLYVILSAGLISDRHLVVLTRRELGAFFYSPIAYIVFFALTVLGWIVYGLFVLRVVESSSPGQQPMLEPIVQYYIVHFIPVVSVAFVVPVITMRLLSEEKRTGTLEVLLTSPVSETTTVLSKFLAALIFFMVIWIPWGLFLVALRVEGGQPFDYRPLISFFIALLFSGAGFLSMGLFFSSLTRNQIASAVLTLMGMLILIGVYFVKFSVVQSNPWSAVLTHASYIDLWLNSLQGKLAARALLFHLSATIFWLFLTVKVLESRKWK
jgi:ABC-type transport system involved in multi-copper enzyme maturation permease subunit